ncbi:hypothetical protein [Microlunatus speluncae]|uniref:hypothetical protein n=1 Tax=Microlunatus speluncae TaxID=2594267 RepID=UPI001C2CEDA9|nr:hypothetical protein [Microlunatus speluncae]
MHDQPDIEWLPWFAVEVVEGRPIAGQLLLAAGSEMLRVALNDFGSAPAILDDDSFDG